MDRGRLSSVELTAFYLARIVQLNPSLHAVIVTSPSALLEALFSDVRRQLHQRRGPLDGIPVLLKDNVDTANMGATAGSDERGTPLMPATARLLSCCATVTLPPNCHRRRTSPGSSVQPCRVVAGLAGAARDEPRMVGPTRLHRAA